MPIQLQIGPVIGSLAPAAVGVETLLQVLRGRGTREAQALADALYELQMGIAQIEAILREPVPVEGEEYALLNARGEQTDTLARGRLALTDPGGGAAQITILADGTPAAVLQGAVGLAIGLLLVNNLGAILSLTDAAGGVQAELDATGGAPQLRIAGQQVVAARQAAVAAVTQTATGAYGANEQAMLNALKASLNDLVTKLSSTTGHGLLT